MKNYYQILGVAQDAEDFVIRAAYKALAQRYHPDKYQGSASEATSKMHEINEAYSMLSNSVKRKNYESSYQNESTSSQNDETDSKSKIDNAWKTALEFYPDLFDAHARLTKFSIEIAEEFKNNLIKNKSFNDFKSLAKEIEKTFLEEHFGHNEKIVEYARNLFLNGYKNALKELNEKLMVMGGVSKS